MDSLTSFAKLTLLTIEAVLGSSKTGLNLRNEMHPLNYDAIGSLRLAGGFHHDDKGDSSNKVKDIHVGFFIPENEIN